MEYTTNPNGGVVRDGGISIPADPLNADYAEYLKWVAAGNTPASPTVSPQTLQASLVDLVQGIMDSKARSFGYDNLTTAVTYADEPAVPKFQEEGQVFRAWRSNVWATAYAILSDVQAGHRPFPTATEVPALLPAFPLQ
jgi:hypothetical protein